MGLQKIFKKIKKDNVKIQIYFCGFKILSYRIPLKERYKNVQIMQGRHIDRFSTIGEHTFIGHNCFITKATIGRYCSIANNVTIGPGEHDLETISTSTLFCAGDIFKALTQKNITIANDVWIGVDSIIRRGVTIGNGAVIGSNSFVNKDVPDFAIVAGNPAKIIKYRFSPQKQQQILNSKWWEYDLATAKKIIQKLEGKQ